MTIIKNVAIATASTVAVSGVLGCHAGIQGNPGNYNKIMLGLSLTFLALIATVLYQVKKDERLVAKATHHAVFIGGMLMLSLAALSAMAVNALVFNGMYSMFNVIAKLGTNVNEVQPLIATL